MYLQSKSEMVQERDSLVAKKMILDKFFSYFLDKVKMDPDKPDTPAWKLYHTKSKEYHDVDREIKILNYRISNV